MKTLKYTPTSDLLNRLEQIQTELKRRKEAIQNIDTALFVKNLPLRATTRATLYGLFKQHSGQQYVAEDTLTLHELMLHIPPTYWQDLRKTKPRQYEEIRQAMSQVSIQLELLDGRVTRAKTAIFSKH